MKSNIRTIEQGRAAFAYRAAEEGLAKASDKKTYSSYVKKIPVLIKTNGLAQTLAFMQSKGNEYDDIYRRISEWLCQKQNSHLLDKAPGKDLLERVISLDSPVYRQVTTEVLSFLNWFRRFSEGIVRKDEK